MFYTIYKITNIVDGKIYIGKHQTKNLDDKYMGSGKRIIYAINKHGFKNFEKEILFIFDNEEEMNSKETELVTEEFCLREDTYNLCAGGKGGFSYLEREGKIHRLNSVTAKVASAKANAKKKELSETNLDWKEEYRKNLSSGLKQYYENGGTNFFLGKKHTEEFKKRHSEKMKLKSKGSSNSQYGTMWITNGFENRKIKSDVVIPEGWHKGRKLYNAAT